MCWQIMCNDRSCHVLYNNSASMSVCLMASGCKWPHLPDGYFPGQYWVLFAHCAGFGGEEANKLLMNMRN